MIEPVLVQDVFVTELAAIEVLPGGIARFICVIEQTLPESEDRGPERVVAAKILMPVGAVLPAVHMTVATLSRHWLGSRLPTIRLHG